MHASHPPPSSTYDLTKTLSATLYRVRYRPVSAREDASSLDVRLTAADLVPLLTRVCGLIGAAPLNVASHDYEPEGASATLLIADNPSAARPNNKESLVAHLDLSHMTAHTYPQTSPDGRIATTRVDVEVSTCGAISPLVALDQLIDAFDCDVGVIDYRVRGFTWDANGQRLFMSEPLSTLLAHLNASHQRDFDIYEPELSAYRTFHMRLRRLRHLSSTTCNAVGPGDAPPSQTAQAAACGHAPCAEMRARVAEEMNALFRGYEGRKLKP